MGGLPLAYRWCTLQLAKDLLENPYMYLAPIANLHLDTIKSLSG